jgi:hypothetical protein
MNQIVIYDLVTPGAFGKHPTPMAYINAGSFDPALESFQPKTVKTSSSMDKILFVADTDAVLILDIADIRNNATAKLTSISSKAT